MPRRCGFDECEMDGREMSEFVKKLDRIDYRSEDSASPFRRLK